MESGAENPKEKDPQPGMVRRAFRFLTRFSQWVAYGSFGVLLIATFFFGFENSLEVFESIPEPLQMILESVIFLSLIWFCFHVIFEMGTGTVRDFRKMFEIKYFKISEKKREAIKAKAAKAAKAKGTEEKSPEESQEEETQSGLETPAEKEK